VPACTFVVAAGRADVARGAAARACVAPGIEPRVTVLPWGVLVRLGATAGVAAGLTVRRRGAAGRGVGRRSQHEQQRQHHDQDGDTPWSRGEERHCDREESRVRRGVSLPKDGGISPRKQSEHRIKRS
jgi:hypothetical protein